jgi:hypothetical protein
MMHVKFFIANGKNKMKGRLQPTLYNVHVLYCISVTMENSPLWVAYSDLL